ncbi:hypothetical protein TrVE_jg11975 [Triparma verrucosa]|uniref:Uncharacterized protein n=1 Tax=Triparma verrucosa TaxID=1606542 RepID=A0A9W7C5B1_9STRA|nr:hypothetical protein TrVE_jg11975 [Triparma verrucosa]
MSTKTLMSLQRSAAAAGRTLSSAAPFQRPTAFASRSATETMRSLRQNAEVKEFAPSVANESSNSSRIEAQRALRIRLANTPKASDVTSSKVPRNRLKTVESVGTSAASMSATARHRMVRGVDVVESSVTAPKALDTSVAQLSATALHRAARSNGVERNANGSHITPQLSVPEILLAGQKKGILYAGVAPASSESSSANFLVTFLGVVTLGGLGVAGLSYGVGGTALALSAGAKEVAPVERKEILGKEATKQPLWLQRERA